MKIDDANQIGMVLYAFMDRIGTHLNVANGYLDLVDSGEAGPLTDEQQQYLDKAEKALARLIESREQGMALLGMWLEEDSLLEQIAKPFRKVISMLRSRFHRESESAGIQIDMHLSEEAGDVPVFSGVISRLLASIVSDGIGLCQTGDRIVIEAKSVTSGVGVSVDFIGSNFVVLVKNLNSNMGIKMSKWPFAFSFFSALNILKLMNGEISLDSMEGGIRFYLMIPNAQQRVEEIV